eukprot:6077434-Pleurochrysis_carterae.AAC.1
MRARTRLDHAHRRLSDGGRAGCCRVLARMHDCVLRALTRLRVYLSRHVFNVATRTRICLSPLERRMVNAKLPLPVSRGCEAVATLGGCLPVRTSTSSRLCAQIHAQIGDII